MAHAGKTLENPVTRDRITFLKTARDTNGESLELEVVFEPLGFVAAEHIHPQQEERFEVLAGTPRFRIGEGERTARPGDVLAVQPGTPHVWWNAGKDETRVRIEFRPALRTETFFETLYGLARDGKLNKQGLPNPLQAAVLAREYAHEIVVPPQREIVLSRLPRPLLTLLIAVGAPLGRVLGYRARYSKYSPD